MIVKITSRRQVTFPARVLDALGVGPGDRLELVESPDGLRLRPHRIRHDCLAPLSDSLHRSRGAFDLEAFRSQAYTPTLRD